VAVNVDVDEIEALAAQPVTASSAGPRTLEVIQQFNRHVLASEVQYRTTMRAYLDMWLSGIAAGDAAPVVREGRRYRWISQTLEPLRGNLTAEQLERLVSALSLVSGFEAIIVLRDVCHLDDDRALEVTEWAATTLLAAAIGTDEV
jgi:hypothetical protein